MHTKAIKKFEFSETRLNEETLSVELEVTLHAGVLVQDGITQAICATAKFTKSKGKKLQREKFRSDTNFLIGDY